MCTSITTSTEISNQRILLSGAIPTSAKTTYASSTLASPSNIVNHLLVLTWNSATDIDYLGPPCTPHLTTISVYSPHDAMISSRSPTPSSTCFVAHFLGNPPLAITQFLKQSDRSSQKKSARDFLLSSPPSSLTSVHSASVRSLTTGFSPRFYNPLLSVTMTDLPNWEQVSPNVVNSSAANREFTTAYYNTAP